MTGSIVTVVVVVVAALWLCCF